jgi:hypothetical protein
VHQRWINRRQTFFAPRGHVGAAEGFGASAAKSNKDVLASTAKRDYVAVFTDEQRPIAA